MEMNANFANKIKHIFLAEPFTERGLDNLSQIGIHMTEEDFFNKKIYIDPFSEYKKTKDDNITEDFDGISYANEIDLSILKKFGKDFENKSLDLDALSYATEIKLNALKKTKEDFESKLSDLDGWLFIIKGVAGSGKTTYLNYLKQNLPKTIIFHIFNFESTKQSISFMSKTFDLKNRYSDNVYKFISLLLIEIADILSKKNSKNIDDHIQHIKKIVDMYNFNFKVSEENMLQSGLLSTNMDIMEQQELFDLLQKYSVKEINYSTLSNELLNIFDRKLNNNDSDIALAFIAGFIIRLYYCLNKIDGKKHICVVDNIETFVKYDEEHPIQECELEKIIKGFFEASHKAREILTPWKQVGKFETFYGFLIVTRDTTASTALFEVQHEDDYRKENEIDISNWYCTEDILQSKISFFLKKGLKYSDDSYAEAYKNILKDFSQYRWGLNEITTKMYKHSHRRNIECIPDAINVVPKEEIAYFNHMWKKTLGKEDYINSLKLMCRKYILRILIDHVQRKNYFDNLMVENNSVKNNVRTLETIYNTINEEPSHNENSSYARKISTLLHRFALEVSKEKYVSFPRIINEILKPINLPDEPTSNQIKNLGKILFLMNETRNEITNWTSLVCMKYDNKEIYSEANLCNIMQKEWENFNQGLIELDDTSRFGVKITEAGSFFAKILPDFEYFCCRFLSNEPPLFSIKNIKPFYINGEKTYRAIAIIRYIRKKAFDCIDAVIERDKNFYSSMENQKTIDFTPMYRNEYSWLYKDSQGTRISVHPDRIINQHKGYVFNYMTYVEHFIPVEKFDNKEHKVDLITQLQKELPYYSQKLRSLIKDNPSYFKNE